MKNYIILFLLQLYFVQTSGQEIKDYSIYSSKIVLIEEETSKENFSEALKMYAELFHSFDFIYASDAYNACQIAAMQNNSKFYEFLYQCGHSGVAGNKLLYNVHIKKYYDSDTTRFKSVFLKGWQEYVVRINSSFRKEFEKRFKLEQENKGKPNYEEICYDNFSRILYLSKHGKFPGEKLIGVNEQLVNDFVFATLAHFPYSYKILYPYLWEGVRSGEIQPLSVLYIYGFNQTRTSALYTRNIHTDTDTTNFQICYNLPFGKQSADINEVNKQRSLKWVFSTEVQHKLEIVASKYKLDYKLGY